MAGWQGAQALLPTKSAPRAPDMANKTRGNRHSIAHYHIVAEHCGCYVKSRSATLEHPVAVAQWRVCPVREGLKLPDRHFAVTLDPS